MTVLDIPLRKVLQLFYAPERLIRLDRKKEEVAMEPRVATFTCPFGRM